MIKMKFKYLFILLIGVFVLVGCTDKEIVVSVINTNITVKADENVNIVENTNTPTSLEETKIIFLHHSTGQNIWDGGVANWFNNYNQQNQTNYNIKETDFPTDEYGWQNYPYDYWNIWVNHDDQAYYQGQPTLDTLTDNYDVIVWKHCYPVSEIIEARQTGDDTRPPLDTKLLSEYKGYYNQLKMKMKEYPDTKFIVWTGAAQPNASIDSEQAGRAQEFFDWVRYTWDETEDNIYIWDFYQWETDGGLYMKDAYAEGPSDPHPNSSFSATVANYFSQRIVSVIEGNGDSTNILGK